MFLTKTSPILLTLATLQVSVLALFPHLQQKQKRDTHGRSVCAGIHTPCTKLLKGNQSEEEHGCISYWLRRDKGYHTHEISSCSLPRDIRGLVSLMWLSSSKLPQQHCCKSIDYLYRLLSGLYCSHWCSYLSSLTVSIQGVLISANVCPLALFLLTLKIILSIICPLHSSINLRISFFNKNFN